MHIFFQTSRLVVLFCTTMVLLGCAGPESRQLASSHPVAVSDFKQVAGKWERLLTPVPRKREDWVELRIKEDGAYHFSSFRMMGEFFGSGTLVLADGKLTTEGDRGRATFTLYESDKGRMLKVDATLRKGLQYMAELTPAK
jgi:hypothetical protein